MIQAIKAHLDDTKRLLAYAAYEGVKRIPFESNSSFRNRLLAIRKRRHVEMCKPVRYNSDRTK